MAAPRNTTPKSDAPAKKTGTDPAEEFGQVVSRTDTDRAFVTSNRFSVANVEVRGRELLALSPINFVGPAPILVPIAELDELISDLVALRDAPGPGDPDQRSNDG